MYVHPISGSTLGFVARHMPSLGPRDVAFVSDDEDYPDEPMGSLVQDENHEASPMKTAKKQVRWKV